MSNWCEICQTKTSTSEKHHIESKSLGGSNKRNNMVRLCSSCHSLVHRNFLTIEGWKLTTVGYKLIWRRTGTESATGLKDPAVYIEGKSNV